MLICYLRSNFTRQEEISPDQLITEASACWSTVDVPAPKYLGHARRESTADAPAPKSLGHTRRESTADVPAPKSLGHARRERTADVPAPKSFGHAHRESTADVPAPKSLGHARRESTADVPTPKFLGQTRGESTADVPAPKSLGHARRESTTDVPTPKFLGQARGESTADVPAPKPLGHTHRHRKIIRVRRAQREMAKESNVPEETDQDLAESAAEATMKPVYLKGLFSVSTTSNKPLRAIRADIIRVLKQLGVTYHEIKGGFECKHAPSIDLNNVVDSPSTPGHPSSSGTGHRHKIGFGGLMGEERERDEFREQQRLPQRPKLSRNRQTPADRSYINSDESEESDGKDDRRANVLKPAGETTTHMQSDLGGSMLLIFEMLIVKVPLLSLHGIQFKKVDGGTWQYKNMAQKILAELRL